MDIPDGSRRYVSDQYRESNPSWHVEDSAWKAERILAILRRNNVYPGSVLEVGCGAGQILVNLEEDMPGASLAGVDIAPDAIAMANRLRPASSSVSYVQGEASAMEPADLVLAMDVAEHVEDYFGFLRMLRGLGEWKVIHVPLALSAQTVARNSPLNSARASVGHIHLFTRDMFHAALEDCGHEVVDWSYESPSLAAPDSFASRARAALFKVNPHFSSRVLGGFSCLYLTR